MEPLELLEKKIARKAARAIHEFSMITEGDRVLVALSGGKDSWTLLNVLLRLRRNSPVKFTVSAATVHPGFPEFDPSPLQKYLSGRGIEYFIERAPLGEIIENHKTPGTSYCAFCARLRRGVLYTFAKREGFTKIALGHHADDLIETLLLAQFFTGEIKSIPPVLLADDGVNVVIRPLCRVFEEEISAYSQVADFPVISCGCPPHRTGAEELNRAKMKKMLSELEKGHHGIKANLLSCLGRVRTRYLMQKNLHILDEGEPCPLKKP
ncbi:tRNA 2-thiocytidine(32) synthetase TtcA [bacterium]|nr:MAG: tRNA 2-thiocytidine(32) synthetase TtcA [bacterium]